MGGGDTQVIAKRVAANLSQHAEGCMRVVGNCGEGDNRINAGLKTGDFVEAVLDDSRVAVEEPPRDFNSIAD